MNPVGNGMSFHKLDRAKDPNLVGARQPRYSSDRPQDRWQSAARYVDHHDKAYQWAERRKLEVHPTTGAAQLVEVRERVEEILVQKYVEDAAGCVDSPKKPKLFAKYADAQLLAYGVPQIGWPT